VLQAESLATIADIIGKADEARAQRERAKALIDAMMTHLWDEERGCFNALRGDERVPVFTPFHLLPLWLDGLPQHVYDRMIAHLTDPAKFWTRFPLPTVAVDDPHFDPLQMWRGPTWVNINYLFVDALQRRGYPDLARDLRRKSLELVMMHDDIYEYYNPFNGERPPKAAPIFGWTSAVFIDMALQETREAAPELL
jgi:glycogen debranching enzyme